MIFVTVGTHEQQFDRLIKYMDEFKANKKTNEDIIIQTGFSTLKPKHCQWNNLYSYNDMITYINSAHIIITHGGPSSFIIPLQMGKIPIVVPRRKIFNEHVNDHQLNFCREINKRNGNIILVENIESLDTAILSYDETVQNMHLYIKNNNKKFCKNLEKIIREII